MTDLTLAAEHTNPITFKKMGLQVPLTAPAKTIAVEPSGRNFGLTAEQYEVMLAELQSGDEAFFERVFLAKFEPMMSLLKRQYRAPHADAYDAVMWAMLRFREYLVGGKIGYGNLEGYFHRIVTNGFLKKLERQREFSDSDGLSLNIPDAADFLEKQFSLEEIGLLDRAWEKMCGKCRAILQGFYYDNLDHKTITELIGDTNEATTRQRKRRCIEELRGHFFQLAGK